MRSVLVVGSTVLLTACATIPQRAGISLPEAYRALGTEPFWNLLADGRRLEFREASAPETPVVQPQPIVETGSGGLRIYRTPRIVARVTPGRCSDGMSDRIFPDTVEATVDGQRFTGCGGEPLPPGDLAGTRWRVDAVNGRTTPPDVDGYTIVFEPERISGRIGCNEFGLAYRREERRIVPAGPPVSTRRSCPDMSFEQSGHAILSRPAALVAEASERISLNNEAGSMTLRRMH